MRKRKVKSPTETINKGVYKFDRPNSVKKWRAVISCYDLSEKSRTLGYFEQWQDAVDCYKAEFLRVQGYSWNGIYIHPDELETGKEV